MEKGLEQVGKKELAGGEGEEELHSKVQYLHRRDVEMFSGTCWT